MAAKKRSADKPKVETITGQVIAVDWDEDDQPTVVAILTDDDQEVLVESSPKGDELLDLIDAVVQASGAINRAEGEPVINIGSFELIEREADKEDEEFEDFEDEEFEEEEEEEFEDEDLDDDDFEDEDLDDDDLDDEDD